MNTCNAHLFSIRAFALSLLFCTVSVLFSSCFPETEAISSLKISFSTDTLIFDTVFTNRGSLTQRVKIFNESGVDIEIPSIRVAGGKTSPFSLVINGRESNTEENIFLRKNDSLLILASVTIDPSDENLPFIVKDSIVFHNDTEWKDINLVAWGQNANYLSDSVLACNTTFTAEKPYVLYNSILIDTLCTLTIEAGARIYSHPGSAIFVGGSLISEGTADNRIEFSNDRKDGIYRNLPGQWEGIYFLEGSQNNQLVFSDINNSTLGIRVGTPDEDEAFDVVLEQVQISNSLEYGVLCFTSDVSMTNTVILNSGKSAFGGFAGGNYYIENCSFVNSGEIVSSRSSLFEFSDNLVLADNSLLEADLSLDVVNSVIWGLFENGINYSIAGNTNSSYQIRYSFLKTSSSEWDVNNNLVNIDPLFNDPFVSDFTLQPNSPLVNYGLDLGLSIDVLGDIRSGLPDLGAFESVQ